MTLHLLKLCVGADSIQDLEAYVAGRVQERRRNGETAESWHTTRILPKRRDELLDGGSLYWVIKGQIAARQAFVDIEPFTDSQGVARCRLRLAPDVTPVRPRPCRPFQGWRYLTPADAPPDMDASDVDVSHLPEDLRRELTRLGLL